MNRSNRMSAPISTPCIRVCQLDAEGETCLGCGRTRAEIGAWSSLEEDARRAIMDRLARMRGGAK